MRKAGVADHGDAQGEGGNAFEAGGQRKVSTAQLEGHPALCTRARLRVRPAVTDRSSFVPPGLRPPRMPWQGHPDNARLSIYECSRFSSSGLSCRSRAMLIPSCSSTNSGRLVNSTL